MCGDEDLPHPAKRRRIAHAIQGTDRGEGTLSPVTVMSSKTSRGPSPVAEAKESRSGSSRSASQSVTPFLAEHLPQQYTGQWTSETTAPAAKAASGSRYCYRHQPGRRQPDEPSMDKLQADLQTLSSSDQQGISHVWALFSAAPAKHRTLMLRGILSQCCFPQLSFLLQNVRELIKIDFLAALPTELGFQILRNLDTASLCKVAQVSRRWRDMADDDVVWHRMCEQHISRKCTKCGWGLPLLEQKRLMESKHNFRLQTMAKEAASDATTIGTATAMDGTPKSLQIRPWKDVYRDRFLIGSNWKHGRYTAKTFRGHTNGVMCLQFNDHVLATGSYDSTIKIWDVASEKEIRTLRGHTAAVRTLQFDDTKLISGSLDNTIKVWNWHTGDCLRTITGHAHGVLSLNFFGAILASGSVDRTVRIWNFEGGSTSTLRGHLDWVNCVKVDAASRTVFSASDDRTIRLWDLDTGRSLRTYEGHVAQVQTVLPLPEDFDCEETNSQGDASDDDHEGSPSGANSAGRASRFDTAFSGGRTLPPRHMLSAGLDGTIRLWDVHTGRCLRVSFGHVEGVWAIAADAMRIVSGAQDCLVKIWDTRSGQCERTIGWHDGPVTCMGMNDSRIASGSDDGEVKMLSFNYFRRAKVLAHDCST